MDDKTNKNKILELYKSPATIFSLRDISLIFKENNYNNLKSKINYYLDKGRLFRARRGFYSKDENYNIFELANKIYTPSYISFETILLKEGIIFQYSEKIILASNISKKMKVKDREIIYRRMKKEILYNKKGIIFENNYYRATKERAFLDTLYLNKNYYFDNLKSINWENCFDLLDIYNQKTLKKEINNYYKDV